MRASIAICPRKKTIKVSPPLSAFNTVDLRAMKTAPVVVHAAVGVKWIWKVKLSVGSDEEENLYYST